MSLLVLTSVCAMVAAAGGSPAPVRARWRWSSAGRWPAAAPARSTTCSTATSTADGSADGLAAGRRRADRAAHAVAFGADAVAALVRDPDRVLQPPDGRARGQRRCLLRGRLHAVAEAHARRRTSSSAAPPGAIPPLAGWAAAHGRLGLGALFLFLIVLLWTPPHFWALALLLAPQYAAARRADAAGRARARRRPRGRCCSTRSRWSRSRSCPACSARSAASTWSSRSRSTRVLCCAGLAAVARADRGPRQRAVSLLAALPGAAVRRRGRRGGRVGRAERGVHAGWRSSTRMSCARSSGVS